MDGKRRSTGDILRCYFSICYVAEMHANREKFKDVQLLYIQ